jgi:endonuclease/exonuclease/phosphatase family metal-dependent hydrolase
MVALSFSIATSRHSFLRKNPSFSKLIETLVLSRFRLVDQLDIEFNSYTEPNLWKDNVGLVVLLERLDSKNQIAVATTHLYYKSKQAREQQAQCFIQNSLRFAGKQGLVLCGDFNCSPNSDEIHWFRSAGFQSGFDEMMNSGQHASFLGGKHSKKWYDFIFHTSQFSAAQVLSMPHCGSTLLPNSQVSSDHVALVEDLVQ